MIDPEVKKQIVVDAVQNNWNDELLLTILKATTEWKKTENNHGVYEKFPQQLKGQVDCDIVSNDFWSVQLLNEAEGRITETVQEEITWQRQ